MLTDQDKIAKLMDESSEYITLLFEDYIKTVKNFSFSKEGIESLSDELNKMVKKIMRMYPHTSERQIRDEIASRFIIILKPL